MKSSLFTEAEFHALKNRMSGIKSDPTGIYHNRVKPKLLEIASWNMQPLKKKLHELIEQELQDKPEPIQEQTFEEFKQTIGY